MRFHLIDRIEEIKTGEYITAVKCITLADDVFDEHFPGYPVFPGSLIMEGLAQLGGSFFEIMMKRGNVKIKRCVLSVVNKLKFRKAAFPGDKLLYRADIVSHKEDYGIIKVIAKIDEEICAEGELTFMFLDIQDETLYKSRQELYKICMRNTREVE